jgi:anti-anti-sigma regulatory factor
MRITTAVVNASTTCLVVEGRVAGVWVTVLAAEMARVRRDRSLVLDLSGVDFVSTDGVELLRDAQQRGAAITALSPVLSNYLSRREGT